MFLSGGDFVNICKVRADRECGFWNGGAHTSAVDRIAMLATGNTTPFDRV